MITRQDYMSGKATHREYYSQFVNEEVKRTLLSTISKKELIDSKDESLNDIALARWDSLGGFSFSKTTGAILTRPTSIRPIDPKLVEEANEGGASSAFLVCVYKEAARQIVEEV